MVSPSVPGVSISLLEPLWGGPVPAGLTPIVGALPQAATIPSCEHLPKPKLLHSISDAL